MLKLICNSHQTIYLGRDLDTQDLEKSCDHKFYVGRVALRRGHAKAYAVVSVLSRDEDQIIEQDLAVNGIVKISKLETNIRLLAITPTPNQAMEIECWNCGKPNLVETHLHMLEALWEFDAPQEVKIHQTRRGIAKRGKQWIKSHNFSF